MTPRDPSASISSLDERMLSALQTVAALEEVPLRDVPLVLGEQSRDLRAAIRAGVFSVSDGVLRPAHPTLAASALAALPTASRRALHRRLAHRSLSEFDAARQRDLSVDDGEDPELAALLEELAIKAELTGRAETAVEFWARSAARSPSDSTARQDRELRFAARAHRTGHAARAAAILGALDWSALTAEQAERGVVLLGAAVRSVSGTAAARLRVRRVIDSLPVGDPLHERLAAYLPLLGEQGRRGWSRDGASPQGTAVFRHARSLALLRAGMDAGAGIDGALLEELREIERTDSGVLPEDTADAAVALNAFTLGEVSASRRALGPLLVRSELDGDVALRQTLVAAAARMDVLQGRFDSADRRLQTAEALATEGPSSALSVAVGVLRLERGDRAGVIRLVRDGSAWSADPRDQMTRRALGGLALARSGEHGAAIPVLESALSVADHAGVVEPGRRLWIDVELALASIRVGDRARARALATGLRAFAETAGRILALQQAARLELLLDAGSISAEDLVERGLAVLQSAETMGWLPERARHTVDVLEALADVPLGHDQRRIIDRSAQGTLLLLEEGTARGALSRAIDRWKQPSAVALTPAERRVAELVGSGLSNKETGERLHLSTRTVESHLHHVFAKLGISSRSRLAACFRVRGE